MIAREYGMNINVPAPRNYFERWYADMWRRRVSEKRCDISVFQSIFLEELEKIGATAPGYDPADYKTRIEFADDKDYTAFVLRWS